MGGRSSDKHSPAADKNHEAPRGRHRAVSGSCRRLRPCVSVFALRSAFLSALQSSLRRPSAWLSPASTRATSPSTAIPPSALLKRWGCFHVWPRFSSRMS